MKNYFLLFSLLFSLTVLGQQDFYKSALFSIDQDLVPADRLPKAFKQFEINFSKLQYTLTKAPYLKKKSTSPLTISLPDANGQAVNFKVFKSGTLPESLRKATNIQTYRGYNKAGDIASIVTSPLGLHVGVLRPGKKDFIITPASKNLNEVIVFTKDQLPPKVFNCYTDAKTVSIDHFKQATKISDGLLRTYRFAVGTTGEYSQFHINRAINAGIISSNATDTEKKDIVLAAVAVTIDRLNSVYERDLGVSLELVSNERNVIFLDPDTDPYDNTDIMSMLNNNTNVLNTNIGSNNYDGGHLFSTYAGGGISGLGIICSSNKGRSVTGSTSPVGDAYDIDYVAHEVGHEFGCNHTFANSCGDNRNIDTAAEPGSGSTIMAYAGVCSPNVQIHSDDYFHQVSIQEVDNFVKNYATCSINSNIGNHTPQLNLVRYSSASIPKSTPFILEVQATDQDGDALTYCWEQIDVPTDSSITSWVPNSTYDNGPLFRSYSPSTNSVRYFPTMANILDNTYGNTWEQLPEVDRKLTFAITVRDNHPGGGQSPYNFNQFSVDSSTGPFRVTNMNNNQTLQAGQSQTITWDVAGTDGNPVNCNTVDILFSNDNGVTFSTIVASNVPNTGSAQFTVPNQNTSLGRFMVKAHANYFFDVAHGRFTIQGATAIKDHSLKSLKIYPNPVKDICHLSFRISDETSEIQISLIDISGREIMKKNYWSKDLFTTQFSTAALAKGIYIIKIKNGINEATKKLILE